MKKRILIVTSFIVLSAIAFLFIQKSCSKDIEKDLFIIKNYGEIKPDRDKGSCTSRNINYTYANEIYGSEKHCLFRYQAGRSPIMVKIDIYQDSEEAVFYQKKWIVIAKLHNKDKRLSMILDIDKLIYYDNNNNRIVGVNWISKKKSITISGGHSELIPNQLIKDYLEKYPPTYSFKESDFDEKEVLKGVIERRFDAILRSEKERGQVTKIGKRREIGIMLGQCEREMWVRCVSGITDDEGRVECKTTMIMPKRERIAAWKALKEEALSGEVYPEKMEWQNFRILICETTDIKLEQKFSELLRD